MTIEVRGPDGKRFRFPDGTSQDEMRDALDKVYKPQPKAQESGGRSGYAGAFLDGLDSLADGMTVGIAPYVRGAVRGAFSDKSIGEEIAAERQDQARRREERPVASFINEAGGGMLTGGGLANAGITMSRFAPQGASLATRSAAIGGDAAVMGGVNAAAEGRDPGTGALTGFALGAGANAGLEKLAGGIARGLRQRQVRNAAPQTGDIKAAQKAAYKAFDAEDVAVSSKAGQRLISDANDRLAGLALSRRQNSRAFSYLDDIAEHTQRADGVSIRTLENINSNIKADLRGGAQGSERTALREVSDAIDDFFEGASQNDVVAGGNMTKAYSVLRGARANTRKLKKAELLDDVFTRAEAAASGDANGIRQGLRSILRDKKKRAMFTKEELEAMRSAVGGGPIGSVLRQFGKLGIAMNHGGSNALGAAIGAGLGGAAMGPVGSVAVPAAASLARAGSDAATVRNARFLQALSNMTDNLPAPGATQMLLNDPKTRAVSADAVAGGLTLGLF